MRRASQLGRTTDRVMACSRKSQLNDHLGVKVRRADVVAECPPPRLTLIPSLHADVQDAVDVLSIPIPVTTCPWEQRKAVLASGLSAPRSRDPPECHRSTGAPLANPTTASLTAR